MNPVTNIIQSLGPSLLEVVNHKAVHVSESYREDWVNSAITYVYEQVTSTEDILSAEQLSERIQLEVKRKIHELSRFNGYDMGFLYSDHIGSVISFNGKMFDASTVLTKKMGLEPLGEFGAGAERSIKLKKELQTKLLKTMHEYGLKPMVEQVETLRTMINEEAQHPEHPWAYFYPDNLYVDNAGETWLFTPKIPGTGEKAAELLRSPSLQEKVKLAFNKGILESKGIKIDHVALAVFDLDKYTTVVREYQEQEINQAFIDDVFAAGDKYQEYLHRGEMPLKRIDKEFEMFEELPPALKALTAELVMLKKANGMVDKAQKEKSKQYIQLVQTLGVEVIGQDPENPAKKTRLPALDIDTKTVNRVDQAFLMKFYEQNGGDMKAPGLYTENLQTSVAVRRGAKNNPHIEAINQLTDISESLIDNVKAESQEMASYFGVEEPVFDPCAIDMVEEHQEKLDEISSEKAPTTASDNGLGF
ncbi:hypothetical protein AB6D11_03035 [Vibrio splendidus]